MGRSVILKFGGASVATPAHFADIAEHVIFAKKRFERVVCVVSAMGDTTDRLVELVREVHPNPPKREFDMLVSVGERVSIALLAMALDRVGQTAVSFTGSQSGIITTCDHTNAKIVEVRPKRILEVLARGHVAIVAGFQGVSRRGEITTLGRGGSDTTAVALGVAMMDEETQNGVDSGAEVHFLKDVDGVYSQDPKKFPKAKKYHSLSYEEMLSLADQEGGSALHKRCVQLAASNQIPLCVRGFDKPSQGVGTVIGKRWSRKQNPPTWEFFAEN